MVDRLGIQSAPHAAQEIRNLMIKIVPCYSCATGSSIFLSLRDYQRYGSLYAIMRDPVINRPKYNKIAMVE
jgi:hypothetical protein